MKKFGKLCLLLVVFGWFCPVACNLSGPQWMKGINGDNIAVALCALGLFASAVSALLGVIFAIIHITKKRNDKTVQSKDNIATSVISTICGFPFFLYLIISSSSLQILNYGAYIMIAGWILSLIFRIKGKDDN